MKNTFLISSIIVIIVLIIAGGTVLLDRSAPKDIPEDVLTEQSLVREINVMREALGLSQLEVDTYLKEEATKESYSSAKRNIGIIDDYKVVSKDTILLGVEGQQYYSASGLVSEWMQDTRKRSVLTRPGTKIGVWATYSMENEKAKPVPWVAVIIN